MRGFNPYHAYILLDQLSEFWQQTSRWPGERVMRCAGQAIQIGALLLETTLRDERTAARREERSVALLAGFAEQMSVLVAILRRCGEHDGLGDVLVGRNQDADVLFAKIPSLPERWLAEVVRSATDRASAALACLPYRMGVERSLDRLRERHGLRALGHEGRRLPYETWVDPSRVAEIFRSPTYGPEDATFRSVHQMTECWLHLAIWLLSEAKAACEASQLSRATSDVGLAAGIIDVLTRHIHLLDLMILIDYHPLRVALKGSSGAQSAAAARTVRSARLLMAPLIEHLARSGYSLLDVYSDPKAHLEEYLYAESLSRLESALAEFYFHHFQRAVRVQSSRGLGALGQGVQSLASRFLSPLYAEIDDVRYDVLMMSNFAYADKQGRLVRRNELAAGVVQAGTAAGDDDAGEALDDATLEQQDVVARYLDALAAGDIDRCLEELAYDAVIEDPAGSRPYTGHAEIKGLLRLYFEAFQGRMQVTRIAAARGEILVDWRTDMVLYTGYSLACTGHYTITLDRQRRIRRLVARWRPAEVADGIGPRVAASRLPNPGGKP